MSKKSTKPKEKRRKIDGSLPEQELSPFLSGPPRNDPETADRFSFFLDDIKEESLDRLSKHESVSFIETGQGLAAKRTVGNVIFGKVPRRYVVQVRQAMRRGYSAWISDVFDRGIQVTVVLT